MEMSLGCTNASIACTVKACSTLDLDTDLAYHHNSE